MRKWIIFIIAAIMVLSIINCGYQEGIRETDKQSYIWFSGQTQDAFATVDNGTPFKLEKVNYIDSDTGEKTNIDSKMLYQVKPGKHEVLVKKNERVVVHRVIMIGTGATKEISVP